MQAIAPVPVGHTAAGEVVDDDDLVFINEVVLVAVEAAVGVNGPLDVLVELRRGVRVRAAGRVGAAEFLAAVVGEAEVGFFRRG